MRRFAVPTIFAIVLAAARLAAQSSPHRKTPPSDAELAGITARGRELAQYDIAAWYGTDSAMALHPDLTRADEYIARRDGDRWIVSFGQLNAASDTFFIAYQAVQGAGPKNFTATALEPRGANTGFELFAARAFKVAKELAAAERRPYNLAVLPADHGRFWVYSVPAPTRAGWWPLGGDFRLLMSPDGRHVLETRKLHKAVNEFGPVDKTTNQDWSTAILDDVPEDTDVFFTLRREPHMPHLVATDQWLYRIAVDGTIKNLGAWPKDKGGSTPPSGL